MITVGYLIEMARKCYLHLGCSKSRLCSSALSALFSLYNYTFYIYCMYGNPMCKISMILQTDTDTTIQFVEHLLKLRGCSLRLLMKVASRFFLFFIITAFSSIIKNSNALEIASQLGLNLHSIFCKVCLKHLDANYIYFCGQTDYVDSVQKR